MLWLTGWIWIYFCFLLTYRNLVQPQQARTELQHGRLTGTMSRPYSISWDCSSDRLLQACRPIAGHWEQGSRPGERVSYSSSDAQLWRLPAEASGAGIQISIGQHSNFGLAEGPSMPPFQLPATMYLQLKQLNVDLIWPFSFITAVAGWHNVCWKRLCIRACVRACVRVSG